MGGRFWADGRLTCPQSAAPQFERGTCSDVGLHGGTGARCTRCDYQRLSALYFALHLVPTGQSCSLLTSST